MDRIVPVKTQTICGYANKQETSYVGTVEESSAVSLSFPVMGTLQNVVVNEGQSVKKGQVLASIDKTNFQNTYLAAKSTLTQAEDAFRRMKELYDKGSLAEIKYVEVQSKLEQAEAMEQMAKKNLDDCVLIAPISGMVSECSVKPGQNVMPGIPIIKLVQTQNVYVKIPIPEGEISSMRNGQKFEFSVSALNNKRFIGLVDIKGIIANPLSHTYEVKLTVSNNNGELMPGMVCQILRKTDKDQGYAYIIPQQAVELAFDGTHFVWTTENGMAKKRVIQIGDLTSQGVMVTEGLNVGDKVIIEGQNKVSEGTKTKEL